MRNTLLLFIYLFAISLFAQNEKPFTIQNAYLQGILDTYDERTFSDFDIDSKDWRRTAVSKLTSNSNIQESSFLKTAMSLHMLKYTLGDSKFYAAIENYKKHLEDTELPADLLDFQYFMENESTKELTYFFNDWFKSKGHPSYEVSWFQQKTSNELSISVTQRQSDDSVDFFELPLPIKLVGENGKSQLVRLEISENGQNFTAEIPFRIVTIEIDPEHHLITKDNLVKLGVDQEVLSKEISLYPNPAVDFMKIYNSGSAQVEKVSIYNMLGKLIIEKSNPISSINVKALATGVHLVKIETSAGTLHKTILKD